MPVYLRTAGYKIYFWSNGSFQIAHNKSNISQKELNRIFTAMESYYFNFLDFWKSYFNEIKFYN